MNKKYITHLIVLFSIIFLVISGSTEKNAKISPPQQIQSNEINPDTSTTEIQKTSQKEIKIVDGLGREVLLSKPAQRIISLAPSNTEILFAVGAGDQVIGRDTLSDYPEAVKNIEDVGGNYGKFDIEKIVSLNPDLVLAQELNPEELVTELEGLNLTVFYMSDPKDLEGMYQNMLSVAELSGHTPETEILVAKLKERVQQVITKIENIDFRPLVFYEIDGTDPSAPWTTGKGTFVDTLLTMAGGINLGSVLDAEWAQISIEEILAQDPDIILIGDAIWGGVTVESVKARSGWEALTAIKNDHIYAFDDNIVSRGGPRLVNGLEELARLLHPDLFE